MGGPHKGGLGIGGAVKQTKKKSKLSKMGPNEERKEGHWQRNAKFGDPEKKLKGRASHHQDASTRE